MFSLPEFDRYLADDLVDFEKDHTAAYLVVGERFDRDHVRRTFPSHESPFRPLPSLPW